MLISVDDIFIGGTTAASVAYVVGNVSPMSAFVVGGAFSLIEGLVNKVTSPFFEIGGVIVKFFLLASQSFVSIELTKELLAHIVGYSFSLKEIFYIAFLPIAAFALLSLGVLVSVGAVKI